MLLPNLNSAKGLCNGTGLIVLYGHIIKARVLTGKARGQVVYIPRIHMQPTDTDLPFTLDRRKFPVALAFVTTINKAHGQSLTHVGIYFPSPVFSQGHLYVAFATGRSKQNKKVLIKNTETRGKIFPRNQRVYTRNIM